MRTLALIAALVAPLGLIAPPVAHAQFVTQCTAANVGAACIYGDLVSTCVQNESDGSYYCDVVANGTKVSTGSDGQPVFTTQGTTKASPSGTGEKITLVNPLGTTSLIELLNSILNFVIQIGTIVIVFMLIFVGFKFVTAQGNESALTDARRMLLWTLIGALILLGAKAISIGLCQTVNALSTGGKAISCFGL